MTHLRPLLLLFFLLSPVVPEPTQDKAALLSFLSKVPHESRLEWNATASACTWVGVTCDAARTAVIALRLPGVGLLGPIPPNTLSQLTSLRVISLRSNSLSGPIPSDLSNLSVLHALYLQHNNFSGEIPPEVGSMERLTRLDLSNNGLDGKIPFAISNLSQLTRLFLQDNNFSGGIPSLDLPALVDFNVSNNRLNGSVPRSLDRFPVSAFSGNLNLCGGPLPPCPPFFSSPAPAPALVGVVAKKNSRKLSKAAIIAISVVAGGILLAALLLLFVIVFRRRKDGGKKEEPKAMGGAAAGEASTSKEAERNKLVFLENGVYGFDLEDLLRASAEVLGKGSVGTSYKAVLEDGTTVVVKRLKDVVASKREFEVHMEEIGKVKHPNVVPIRAFYYSKDEKLLVSDYLAAGSLSALLHGSRGSGRTPLDWDNRLRIALASGRGLVHLHHSARVVHGNIKASNVLLRAEPDAATFSDFGLSPLFGTAVPTNRVAGYRAPEVLETRRPTYKSDMYSFGVLLLELLTGKAPSQASLGEEGIDLPRWVQSVVREEWTAEVFDVELVRSGENIEEEMVQLLQLAMACVSQVPDSRPGILEVVKMMEEIVSRREGEDTMRPSSDDRSGGPTPPAASTP